MEAHVLVNSVKAAHETINHVTSWFLLKLLSKLNLVEWMCGLDTSDAAECVEPWFSIFQFFLSLGGMLFTCFLALYKANKFAQSDAYERQNRQSESDSAHRPAAMAAEVAKGLGEQLKTLGDNTRQLMAGASGIIKGAGDNLKGVLTGWLRMPCCRKQEDFTILSEDNNDALSAADDGTACERGQYSSAYEA